MTSFGGRRSLLRPTFLHLSGMAGLIGLATALVNPFLSVFVTRELAVGPVRLAVFLLLTSTAALAVSTALGWLSDVRLSRRSLLVAGSVAAACAYGLFAVLRDYEWLLAVSMTLAAVGSTVIPQLFAQARESLRDEGALAISSLRMLFSVAWVVGPPVAALLLDRAGFDGLFAVVAVVYVLTALLAVRIESATPTPRERQEPRGSVFSANVVVATLAMVALQTASTLGLLALPLLITGELHASMGTVGLTVGLAAALEIPLMPAFGALAGRIRHRWLVAGGAVAGIGYYAAVAVAEQTWLIMAAQLLSAVFVAAIMGVGISFFQDIMPNRVGSATTLYSNTSKISAMVAGPLLGIAQVWGFRSVFTVSAALCAVGLVLLVLPTASRA